MPVRTNLKAPIYGRVTTDGWPIEPVPFRSKPERPARQKFDPAKTVRIIVVHGGGLNKEGGLNLSARIGLWLAMRKAAQLRSENIQYQYLFTPGLSPNQLLGFQRPCDLMSMYVALHDSHNGKPVIVPSREVNFAGKSDRSLAAHFAGESADKRNAASVIVW